MGSPIATTAAAVVGSGASLLELLEPIGADLARVEEHLAEQVGAFDPGVAEYVQYVLGASGKRLRPALALLTGGATGGIRQEHITLGTIVELIHVATLVHDDVLDEAQLRHGMATASAQWGNDVSVLLGDCLFAHALKLAASYPTTTVCRRVSEATNTVCSGEILQNRRRFDVTLTVGEYENIIMMKTGALFAVSCELGASLNGSFPAVVKAVYEFGAHLGIAYQIYDDCVDIVGQERKAGKSLGTDMKKGKLTLPLLLLLQEADGDRRRELGERVFAEDPASHRELRALVEHHGVVGKSLAEMNTYIRRAEKNLLDLPVNQHSATLADLLRYLSSQSQQLLARA